MTELVIIADDLTGAADCAAPMAKRTATSLVLDIEGDWPRAGAVAVDTDSRYCPADVAADRVVRATERGSALGARLFKKIDSTLRGNIAVELRAMTDALSRRTRPLVVVAPAFPATGRTTVDGRVHVHGAPLQAAEHSGHVPTLLHAAGLSTALLPVDRLQDAESVANAYAAARSAGADAVVVDAETDDHLRLAAEAVRLDQGPLLLCGSGGVARWLGDAYAVGAPGYRRRTTQPRRNETVLVVVGSHAAVARAQVDRLSASPGVSRVLLSADGPATARAVRERLLDGHVLLTPDPQDPVRPDHAQAVAGRLAQAAVAGLDRAGTLVATGGETARAILTEAGTQHLDVVGEREPGVVHSHVPALGIDLVSKAGAFGDPGSLLRCLTPFPAVQPEGEETA